MNPEQDRRPEEELKDILRQLKDEIRLRDVKLTNIEWQLRLIAEIIRRRKCNRSRGFNPLSLPT
jgi:hypothetical protein